MKFLALSLQYKWEIQRDAPRKETDGQTMNRDETWLF